MAMAADRRFVNHVGPFLYRPGERQLAARLFELLGCRTSDTGGKYLGVRIGPDNGAGDRAKPFIMFATEVTPEQWAFDQALSRSIGREGALAAAYGKYDALL